MARIHLVPLDRLEPDIREIVDGMPPGGTRPAVFQAMGHLGTTFAAFWRFYLPLRLGGLLEARLKELVRLKIASLNDCAT